MDMDLFEANKKQWVSLCVQGRDKEARELYYDKLFPSIEKKFIEETERRISSGEMPRYEYLVLPMGLEDSYYILLIKVMKPKFVYFIGTVDAVAFFLDNIIKRTGLQQSQYTKDVIEYDKMNTLDVYNKIKHNLNVFGKGKKVAVDLTRGKRVMSAAAAMVGAFFGCDLIYIDEGWIDTIKRGEPGTERLVHVENPFFVFGDLEERYAVELFNKNEYAAAAGFYTQLRDKTSDPREFDVKSSLAEAYDQWDAFNYSAAYHTMENVMKKIRQYNVVSSYNKKIEENIETLRILKEAQRTDCKFFELLKDDNMAKHMLVDIYCNASRRVEQHRLEDAIARLYRMIELASQMEFAKMGVDTGAPDYSLLNASLPESYESTMKYLFSSNELPKSINVAGKRILLPVQIALMNGHTILFALKNKLWEGRDISELKELWECAQRRDMSIIAHGNDLVSPKTFERIKRLTTDMLKRACGDDFTTLVNEHQFVRLD